MEFNEIVRKLKKRRKGRGSYRKLAKDLGYCHSCMWAWESGKRNIRLKQFIDWAKFLGYRVELVEDDPED